MNRTSIDIDQIPALRELVARAERAGEVLLTREGQPVARITPLPALAPRRPGSARGQIHMADDFDAMPEHLRAYF